MEDAVRVNHCILAADIAALYGPDGKLLHPTQIPADLRRAISRIKLRVENLASGDAKQDHTVEIWLEPKGPAIDREYRRHQLMVDKVQHEHKMTLEHLVALSRRLPDDPDRGSG